MNDFAGMEELLNDFLLEAGDMQAAQAQVGLALAAVDQWGMTGRMDIGYLWTHLPEPPWALLERSGARQSLRPFSRLAAPIWVAASVAYLRDRETLQDRMGGRQRGAAAAGGGGRGAAKGRGRGKRKGAEDAPAPAAA